MQNFTRLLFIGLGLIMFFSGDTQKRYLEPVFSSVDVSAPMPVASNYTILPWIAGQLQNPPVQGNVSRQPLVAQFYTPKGDTATNRPLIVYIHTGNFFPFPLNGSCGGTLGDSTNVEFATRLAKMGYVVAVVNYRQGWAPTASQELTRRYTLINAAYRGVQDMRSYIRYFKRSATDLGNPHGIDASKITLWGQGTGGYLSLATAYLDKYSEILTTSDPNKFRLPPQAGSLPMVIEQYNGNINGNGPITTVDALYNQISQLPVGDTLCIPNHVTFANGDTINSGFALAVNMGGALGDSTWMNAGEIPVISYHVPSDPFAPYMTDILNVPTQGGAQPVVEVSGSFDVQKIADRLSLNDIFSTIPAGNDPYGDIKNIGFKGLCPFVNEDTSSPWEWTSSMLPPGAPTDCNTDAASSRMYIDTIVGYFAPRACVALNLNCDFTSSVQDLQDEEVNLRFAPNPAANSVRFNTNADSPIQSVNVYDMTGKQIKAFRTVDNNDFTLQRDNLQTGMYIVQLHFEKGVISKKIIFN